MMDTFNPKTTPLPAADLARDLAKSPLSHADEGDHPEEAADDSDKRGDQASVVDSALTNLPPG